MWIVWVLLGTVAGFVFLKFMLGLVVSLVQWTFWMIVHAVILLGRLLWFVVIGVVMMATGLFDLVTGRNRVRQE